MSVIKNPFAESMRKNGYSVTINYPSYEKRISISNDEIVNRNMDMITRIIIDKAKDMPIEQLNEYMDKIFEALKNLIN